MRNWVVFVVAACLASPLVARSGSAGHSLDGCPASEAEVRAFVKGLRPLPGDGDPQARYFDGRNVRVLGFTPVTLIAWFEDDRVAEFEIYLPRKDHRNVLRAFQQRYPAADCDKDDCEVELAADPPDGVLEDAGFYPAPSDEPGSRLACFY